MTPISRFRQTTFRLLACLLMALVAAQIADAAGKTVIYKDGATELEGYLAMPAKVDTSMPAILVVHDWKGNGDYSMRRADMLAEEGFVAFAVDIYGKGVRPQTNDEARTEATKYYIDRGLMQRRMLAAFEEVKRVKGVDSKRIGAMGYCFGGQAALEIARAGADVVGVISFHGSLVPADTNHLKPITAKVLVFHGADDPFVSAENIAAFQKEMNAAKVDWELVMYSGAVHSFTKKEAGNDLSQGQAYNERADKRSWEQMDDFWEECFGE